MNYLKWLWITSILIFVGYFLKVYFERGFDSVLFASGIAILVSGIGLIK